MTLIRALFWPAAYKAERLGCERSNLTRIPIEAVCREALRDCVEFAKFLQNWHIHRALHKTRLPILLAIGFVSPLIITMALAKELTVIFLALQSHGLDTTIDRIYNGSLKHFLFIVFVLPYMLEFFVWNKELDDELAINPGCPETGPARGTFRGQLMLEPPMRSHRSAPSPHELSTQYGRLLKSFSNRGVNPEEHTRGKLLEVMRSVTFEIKDEES